MSGLFLTVLQLLMGFRTNGSDDLLVEAEESIENLLGLQTNEVHGILELTQLETTTERNEENIASACLKRRG